MRFLLPKLTGKNKQSENQCNQVVHQNPASVPSEHDASAPRCPALGTTGNTTQCNNQCESVSESLWPFNQSETFSCSEDLDKRIATVESDDSALSNVSERFVFMYNDPHSSSCTQMPHGARVDGAFAGSVPEVAAAPGGKRCEGEHGASHCVDDATDAACAAAYTLEADESVDVHGVNNLAEWSAKQARPPSCTVDENPAASDEHYDQQQEQSQADDSLTGSAKASRQRKDRASHRGFSQRYRQHLDDLAERRREQEEQARAAEKAVHERRQRLAQKVLSYARNATKSRLRSASPVKLQDRAGAHDATKQQKHAMQAQWGRGNHNEMNQLHDSAASLSDSDDNDNVDGAVSSDDTKQQQRAHSCKPMHSKRSSMSTTAAAEQHTMPVVSRLDHNLEQKRKMEREFGVQEAIWRWKNKIHPTQKVFRVLGGYEDVRNELIKRGWVEAPGNLNAHYDLLWCLKSRDAHILSSGSRTIVNHFNKAAPLTTKSGLLQSLHELRWMPGRQLPDSFFPRAFSLFDDSGGVDDFITEFKWTAAACIVKRACSGTAPAGDLDAVEFALQVCEWRLAYIREQFGSADVDEAKPLPPLSEPQWESILKAPAADDASPLDETCTMRSKEVADQLSRVCPQWTLDGASNLWIVKPAGKSRGRGIKVFHDLSGILRYTGLDAKSVREKFVVQKYIERPLLIHSRKFDVRQWVLVTDWNPLTLWFYNTCYLRFCAKDFSLRDLDTFTHLSNNCVAKECDTFESKSVGESNMWFLETFLHYMQHQLGFSSDFWHNHVRKKMEEAVVSTALCSRDSVNCWKNAFDLFGYDFMLDEALTPWLLEVNSSPSMEHSTPVTHQLCQQVIADTLKLVVDVPEERERRKANNDALMPEDPTEWDTGDWCLLFREKQPLREPCREAAATLEVSGSQMKVPQQYNTKRRVRKQLQRPTKLSKHQRTPGSKKRNNSRRTQTGPMEQTGKAGNKKHKHK